MLYYIHNIRKGENKMTKTDRVVIVERAVQNRAEFNNIGKLSKSEKQKFENQMKVYSRNFLKENFDMKLEIPIKIDGRLTRTGGSYHHTTKKALMIKVSERFMYGALLDETEGVGAILDILEHELVHYALHMQGKDYNDGSKEFEETLARLNVGSSGATAKKKRLSAKKNVWYNIYDIYHNKVLGTTNLYKHTKKEQDWIGNRVGYRIVKSYF